MCRSQFYESTSNTLVVPFELLTPIHGTSSSLLFVVDLWTSILHRYIIILPTGGLVTVGNGKAK